MLCYTQWMKKADYCLEKEDMYKKREYVAEVTVLGTAKALNGRLLKKG